MSEELRIVVSMALGIAWCLWVGISWFRHRPRLAIANNQPVFAYASQTGHARAAAQTHTNSYNNALLIPLNKLTPQHYSLATEMHFFVSTYGEGEAPDNGHGFIQSLNSINQDIIQSLKFTVTALGDSRYPAFCAFGKQVYQQLTHIGAQPLSDIRFIDANAKKTADKLLGFTTAKLIKRTHLNPDSEHPGLYQLHLDAKNLTWKPGDILEVLPPEKGKYGAPRSYSIASAASDLHNDQLTLLVRLHITPDGNQGLASRFLTQTCREGASLTVKVRANPSCQLTETNTPLLLIGAGSGLAGLLGHIEQRSLTANAGPIWLIYGERDPECDHHLATDIAHWQQQKVLSRVDRVFSRQNGAEKYVQDVLLEQPQAIKAFLKQHGDIYVCGNLAGMGKAVHHALTQILGQSALESLTASGRYHRDLY
ncbi:flavodoxin domain-containing protein [Thalassotalea sp. 1_MG-2023]|uniref:flavodoxin domain-containing protein n=1 Tax=Thalassotalea sp. 1_MG-2023 TaxID=3062680 RepID=UPI0026E170CF|nr:flavodoxin domain-containing protein [Thalassotalea sp. 1_MG-2023]MDO6428603.1 flavodoxin domain-containing protein [Thalassotalea sp. 1_MG-2023]